jgi:hypothetical protein
LQLASNNGTTAVTIDTSQNVGIGTASPSGKLHVSGGQSYVTGASGSGAYSRWYNNAQTTNDFQVGQGWASASDNVAVLNNNANAAMILGTNGTERMRITSAGATQIKSTTGATPTYSFTNNGEGLLFRYNDDSGVRAADIVAIGNTPAGAAMNMRFWTNNTGTDAAAERMRINSSGSVGIGVTPDSNYFLTVQSTSDDNKNAIKVNQASTATRYQITFNNPNGMVGSISTTGSATAYTTSSDYRLKENITPMTGALAKVSQLKPVIYKWKVDGSDGEGFIAHELQEVIPEAVSGIKDAVDKDGNPVHQGVDTSFLVATLTAAIQELKAINDTQAETINALTARIVAIESRGTV